MTNNGPHARTPRVRGDKLLATVASAWIVPAAVLTVVQLLAVGKLTPVVIAVDTVAAFLVPFGLLALVVAFERPHNGHPPADDDDNGGGRPPDDVQPVLPSGGLDIDWEQFELDFRAYASAREVSV